MKKFTLLKLFMLLLFSAKLFAGTFYWVGGTGKWSEYNTHWATASGGLIFHNQVPSFNDTVIFDGNSFPTAGDTLYLDSTQLFCNTMNWTSVTNNPVLSGTNLSNLNVYGSLLLSNNMIWSFSGSLYLHSTAQGNLIGTAGHTIEKMYVGMAPGGSWELTDSLYCHNLHLGKGKFISNNHLIRVDDQSYWNNDTLLLGTSTLRFTNCNISAPVIDADSAYFFANNSLNLPFGNTYHFAQAASVSTPSGPPGTFSHFDNVVLTGQGGFGCDSCSVDSLISLGFTIFQSSLRYSIVNYARFDGETWILGNNVFDTLVLNNPGKKVLLQSAKTQTITGELIVNSNCSNWITITALGQNTSATITKTNGNVSASYLLLQDIAATGGATFTANNSIALSNVSGWTVNTPASQNLYWVGGSGNWNDSAHWSTSSGGSGGACTPSPIDDVFFDANSFLSAGDTVFFSSDAFFCHNLNASAVANQPEFYSPMCCGQKELNVFGSFILSPNLGWHFNDKLLFKATNSGNIINTAGQQLSITEFGGNLPAGEWTLADSISAYRIYIHKGTFRSADNLIRVSNDLRISCDSAFLGTSTIISNTSEILTVGTGLDADSTTFINDNILLNIGQHVYHVFTKTLSKYSHSGPALVIDKVSLKNNSDNLLMWCDSCFIDTIYSYKDLQINGEDGTLSVNYLQAKGNVLLLGHNVIDTAFFDNPGKTISLEGNAIQNITGDIIFNTSCSSWTSLAGLHSGYSGIISKTSGTINTSHLLIKDIIATGGATFNANNSIALNNVSGWNVVAPAPQNLYWVGGSGNWNDASHWATSSGGVAGSCIPSPSDDVYFDANSFSSAGDTVFFSSDANCRSFDASTVSNQPLFYCSNVQNLKVYGSLFLSPNLSWNYSGNVIFSATTQGHVVNSGGHDFKLLRFGEYAGGAWSLADSLSVNDLYFNKGKLNSSNHLIRAHQSFYGTGDTLLLGTSHVYTGTAYLYMSPSALDADSAELWSNSLYAGPGQKYHHITTGSFQCVTSFPVPSTYVNRLTMQSNATLNFVTCDSCKIDSLICSDDLNFDSDMGVSTVNYAYMGGNVILRGNSVFDTLFFDNPGKTIELESGYTQTISGALFANANPGFPTYLRSFYNGTANIVKANDTVCLDNFIIRDIHATGGAQFYAGINSTDMGNNSGWLWTSCSLPFSDVWPGDANYDLITNNTDIIYIGLAYGNTGYVRPGANLSYTAQPCQDWNTVFQNLTNVKNADCDGNGMVNAADTNAVSLNYGMSHPAKFGNFPAQPNATAPDLFFAPTQTNYAPGTWVSIPIHLGNSTTTASNFYGLAFRINYDATQIVPGSVAINYSGSWLTPSGNLVHLEKDFYASQYMELGMARTDHNNASGNGLIATLVFQVAPSATGGNINFSFSNVTAMDNMENIAVVNAISNNVNIDVGLEEILSEASVGCFPNPFNNEINFTFGLKEKSNVKIDVISADGVELRSFVKNNLPAGKQQLMYDCKEIPAGIYFCRITVGNSLKVVKLVKR